MRAESWLAKKLIVDRLSNGKIYIDADKIHQLKWPHCKAICFHQFINLFDRGNSIAGNSKGFTVKISRNTINNKARSVLYQPRSFSDLFDIILCPIHHK